MAELRSFVIGVAIAGALLLFAAVAFGLFSSEDGSSSPSVRLLGTPPATRTPEPPATQDPSDVTPLPADTAAPAATQPPDGNPQAGETPPAEQPTQSTQPADTPAPTPTLEIAPTEAPTAVPTNTPSDSPVQAYTAAADPLVFGLQGQVQYLMANTGNPAVGDADWAAFTVQAAQTVQSLAGQLSALSPPACLSGAHGSFVEAANLANQGAAQAISGANAGDVAQLSAANSSLAGANTALNQGIAQSQGASC